MIVPSPSQVRHMGDSIIKDYGVNQVAACSMMVLLYIYVRDNKTIGCGDVLISFRVNKDT